MKYGQKLLKQTNKLMEKTFRQRQRIVVSRAGPPLLHMPFGDPASGAAAVPLTCRAAAAQGSGGPAALTGRESLGRSRQIFPLLLLGSKTKHCIYLLFLCQTVTCKQSCWGMQGLARNLAVTAFLFRKRKHVYLCMCVHMCLDGERR